MFLFPPRGVIHPLSLVRRTPPASIKWFGPSKPLTRWPLAILGAGLMIYTNNLLSGAADCKNNQLTRLFALAINKHIIKQSLESS